MSRRFFFDSRKGRRYRLISLCVGCSSQKSKETEQVRPVKTMVVAAGNKPNVRTFPGKVEAAKSVDLTIPGTWLKLKAVGSTDAAKNPFSQVSDSNAPLCCSV